MIKDETASAFYKCFPNVVRLRSLIVCVLCRIAIDVDVRDHVLMSKLVESCIGTKFSARWSEKLVQMALDAVLRVAIDVGGRKEVDIKR